ncbi:MAG: hypothetical protein LBU58_04840, partial [Clostridiales bacterium]|nr:hypothetical protein [Clostridiales bacterium]
MSKKSKLKQYRQAQAARSGNRLDALTTYLAVLTLSVAPLVFRMVRLDFVSPVITNTTTADTGTMTDTFTHVKMWMIYLLVGALLLIFCYKLFASAASSPASAAVPVYAFELTAYDALLAALCALLLLSFFFSDYKAVALNGFVYMLDGTLEHVCYCFLFFFGFHIFSKSPRRTLFLVPLYIVGIVNALISLLNFLGVRMIDTAIIKAVLGIPVNARATDAAAFTSTFGNINYLSGFGGVLFAIFFARLLFPATSAAPRRFVSSASPAPVPVPAPVPPHRSASSSSSASPVPSVPSAPSASSLPPSALANARLSTLIESGVSLLMVAVAFSIIVTSLSSSGFLTFVVMTPVTLIFAALSGVTRRKAILAGAALVVCALIFVPLAARNPAVYEETFGIFGALTQRSVEGENPEGLLDAPPVSDMLSEREAGAE